MRSVLHSKRSRHRGRQHPVTHSDHSLVFSRQGIFGHGKDHVLAYNEEGRHRGRGRPKLHTPILSLRQFLMLEQEGEYRLVEHCRLLDIAQVAGRRNNDQLGAWDLRLHGAAYGGWCEPVVLAED